MEITNITAEYTTTETPLFYLYRWWDVPQTGNYGLPPMPAGFTLDPNYPDMALSDTALLITKGMWTYVSGDLSSTFSTGDGAFRHRRPGFYRVIAIAPLNGQLCVLPKDGAIWGRQVVAVPSGETLNIGPFPEDRYLIVGRGLLTLSNGEEILNTVPLRVAAGEPLSITAGAAALALLMWK